MRRIKLTNGVEYEVDRCGADERHLMINIISQLTMLNAVATFSQSALTQRIEHYFEGTETDHVVFDGYTCLVAVSISNTGILLTLGKE